MLLDNAVREQLPTVGIIASFFLAIGMIIDPEFSQQGRELLRSIASDAPPDITEGVLRFCQRLAATRDEFAQAATVIETIGLADG